MAQPPRPLPPRSDYRVFATRRVSLERTLEKYRARDSERWARKEEG